MQKLDYILDKAIKQVKNRTSVDEFIIALFVLVT